MANYHIHVYQPARMVHYDIDASTPEQAKHEAMDSFLAGKEQTVHPDCKAIAMIWNEKMQIQGVGDDNGRSA